MFRSGDRRATSRILVLMLLAASVVAAVAVDATAANGEGERGAGSDFPPVPTAAQTRMALESGNAEQLVQEPETDLYAAQTLPHEDLGRAEALELAEAVFAPEIESPGAIYDELEPEKFLSDFAAVVPASSLPESTETVGGTLPTEHPNLPVLVESTLPLRTENDSGEEEVVDLQLEHSEGELQSRNSPAEVGIPGQLGEGITMGGAEVEITVANTPDSRTATNAAGGFAFYPEVSTDSDLIVTPTPQGLETMVDLRSPHAPTETTYELALSPSAELRANGEGGAEVVEGARSIVVIPPPTALDAAGNPVDTELAVSAGTITVTAKPTPSSVFPILVDPVFVEEGWHWTLARESIWAWTPSSTSWGALTPFGSEAWFPTDQYPGLDLSSGRGGGGWSHPGDHADWSYWVPRYLTDIQAGLEAPTTWVYQMYVEGPQFYEWGNTENYPALVMGLVDPTYGWQGKIAVHYGGNGDLNSWSEPYWFNNPTEQPGTKGADMNLVTYAEERPAKLRDTYMPMATVAVVDEDAPEVIYVNPPQGWTANWATVPSYETQDRGLGVKFTEVLYGGAVVEQLSLPCSGGALSPCPRLVTQAQQQLKFRTTNLPTGLDWFYVAVNDPMWAKGIGGHTGISSKVLVKVDHSAPEAVLSGSLTEQGSLGTRLPAYVLRVNAKDGSSGAPQSGIKKVEVKVDGSPAALPEKAEWEPNCQTENCAVSDEWTLNSAEYAAGTHEVQVVATDAVGNVTTKTIQIELQHPAPTLSISGTLTEQATLGTELPGYKLKVAASALTESPPPAGLPAYTSSFGTSGTGNLQFAHPGDVAVGNEGALFVVDTNNNRVERFTSAGQYVSQFGTKGSGNGQLNRPTAIAVAANGNVWVTDSLNRRVEEFTKTGAYVAQFGTAGTGNGQFAGSGPEGIAIDYHGNIWVSDTYGGRLEKFDEEGKFIRSVGVKGTGYEQLGQPTAVEVAPGGQVYVTDWEDDKVAEYGEGGAFIRQFGSQGNEPGQLQQPTGIAIDSRGDVWVGDQENGRVEEFNQAGEYLGRFGTSGSGSGQFNLKYPIGIATDTKGDIWVTDSENNRVEKWVSSSYAIPSGWSYLRTVGSSGSGTGQFNWPVDVTVDAKGNIWVTDHLNNRVLKYNEQGVYQTGAGWGPGTANGQLTNPIATAIDPAGNLWVLDRGNSRVEEYSESCAFIRAFGTLGSGNGQMNMPSGIGVDGKGHVWVADTLNNRLEEFSTTGVFIRSVGTKGSGPGQLSGPNGLTVTPEGNVWVADTNNNRLEEFSETGAFIRTIGGAGTGVGRLGGPGDVSVDAAGHLWVAEQGNHRVQELTPSGEFLAEFGTAGTGTGQFQTILPLAFAHNWNILVGDFGNNLVTEWKRPTSHSQVATEITVDGRRYDAGEVGCSAETCAASREWTLDASKFSPGSHVVVVRATDGLGNTTTKTLNVKVGDTTKPGLEVGGELAAAPEGWVQQAEGNYSLTANATDNGFGVTKLAFKIDGKSIASKEQTCAAGKCAATVSTNVNVATLAAGAHEAEVTATDGAGNSTTRDWTVSVDPQGVISVEELVATAEAVEETIGSPIISAGEVPDLSGSTEGVSLKEKEESASGFRAAGTYVPMEVAQNPADGFTVYANGLTGLAPACDEVQEPEEPCVPRAVLEEAEAEEEKQVSEGLKHVGMLPITVKPVETGPATTEGVLLEEQAIGSGNAAGEEADTFTRPMSDGGLSFAAIRSSASPEHFAYEMNLSPELHLRQANPAQIEVFYWKYDVTSSVITAEQAHDAIGSAVPTHLSISGPAKITLTVEHRGASPAGGGFVYPVMGGTGWQGGYYLSSYEMNEPLPPAETEEEEEELEEEDISVEVGSEFVRVGYLGFGPQHLVYGGGAYPTPNKGWVQYISRECDWLSGEVSGEDPGDGTKPHPPPTGGGKYAGPSKEVLNKLLVHCHKHPNDQGGWIRPRFAIEVNGTYSFVKGKEAKMRTGPECRVAGVFPPTKVSCGNFGEVSTSRPNPKVHAENRVWFAPGTYKGIVPWCAILEVTLPSEPKLWGKHSFDIEYAIEHYFHWYTHAQSAHETAGQCPWGHF